MKYYAGLDVSLNTTAICIMNDAREIVLEDVVETDAKCINDFLTSTKFPIELVGLESGFISHSLFCSLKEVSPQMPLKCMDARKVAAALKTNINKTDRKDAQGIADCLRGGFYSEVHIKSHASMELGSMLQIRYTLVKGIGALKSALRGQLRTYGIKLKANESGFTDSVAEAIKALSADLTLCMNSMLKSMIALQTNLVAIDGKLSDLAKANEDVKLLQTIPGIGPITALAFVSELDDPKRFKNSRTVAAYFGLTPKQYSSGEKKVLMGISKQGSTMVRAYLVGAAMSHQRSKKWSKLKSWSMRIAKKHGSRKARVALARKTCTVMHRMLITREAFRLTDITPKEERDLQAQANKGKKKKLHKVA